MDFKGGQKIAPESTVRDPKNQEMKIASTKFPSRFRNNQWKATIKRNVKDGRKENQITKSMHEKC